MKFFIKLVYVYYVSGKIFCVIILYLCICLIFFIEGIIWRWYVNNWWRKCNWYKRYWWIWLGYDWWIVSCNGRFGFVNWWVLLKVK